MTIMTAPRARHSGVRRAAIGAGAFALLATGILTAGGAPATAAPVAPPGSATTTVENSKLIGSSQNEGVTEVFVYVGAGESLYTSFESVYTAGWLDTDVQTGKVIIKDPTGAVAYDSGMQTAPSGVFGGTFTSATAGVWVVETHDPETKKAANFDWQIAALDSSGSSISGRMFFESLGLHSNLDKFSDMELTAINAQGAQYQVNLRGYNGVDSAINMNNIGNAKAGTAESVFKSTPDMSNTELGDQNADYWTPRSSADVDGLQAFRMFFEAPDTSIPLGDVPWGDGRTGDKWVNAELKTPEVDVTEFARTGTSSNAGTVTGTLANAYGLVKVQIDANGNGSYGDPEDVTKNVQVNKPGSFSLKWDGKDATGKDTGLEVPVSFKASMSQTNPIHFVRADVEYSEGGIEMIALNGPNAGDDTVYWDDTMFANTSGERSSTTPVIDGTAGASSGGGVHTWVAGQVFPNQNNSRTGSWGDQRNIDDWTFQKFDSADELKIDPVAASIEVTKYVNSEDANAPDTAAEVTDGKPLEFTATIKNGGGSSLNLALQDDVLPDGAFTCDTMLLAPFASTECKATGDVLKPGEWHQNTLTVIGTPTNGGPPVKDEDPANAYNPGINITKFINEKDANTVADAVELKPDEDGNVKGVVTNPLKVPVTIKVTDDVIAADKITCSTYELAPGASTNCTAILPALGEGKQHVNTMTVEAITKKGTKVTDSDPAHAFTAPSPTPTVPAPGAPAPSSDGSSLATTGAEAPGIGTAIGAGVIALLGGAWFVIRNRRRAKAE
ncbi:hypothetical protein [Pseudoclavibacter sp. VKM Ac-2867]|uniref:hypothetical protein n=1 Tax=Pseudoclavibacter sp. VKM Ac-2867 TaxID=2783829 RepID=UPI00188BDC35|nr:hypothetical protein [Pseudoclavibacter sp. VKM Ac-2867]MBF4459497.1 hypothetical protein [Pseudoclavibacter sp. VKM Ac-2867]